MIQPVGLSISRLVFVFAAVAVVSVASVALIGRPDAEGAQIVNPIPAFPGAEGYGALALSTCDRSDTKVIEVTSLDSSGPGSFRDAIENQLRDDKLDIIIFRTGGTIVGNIGMIERSCVYIAGQTAPGDGLQIHGTPKTLGIARSGKGNNIVIRYLRLRSDKGDPGKLDVMTVSGGHDIILDHVSFQWGNDEVLTIRPVTNRGTSPHDITFQRSIIAEGLKPHSTGMLLGNSTEGAPPTYRVSGHHNVYAHNSHRNPTGSSVNTQFANNIVYNWNSKIGMTEAGAEWDYVNNVYTKGPWSRGGDNNDDNTWIRHASCPHTTGVPFPVTPSIYIEGNIFGKGSTPDADQWTWIRQRIDCGTTYTRGEELPLSWRRFTPVPDAEIPVTLQSANDARASVLADVGANRRLDCDGSWVWVQDIVDSDIIQDIQLGTGPATDEENDHPDDYGGFPVLDPGTPCLDTDGDGMPDEWEQRYFASITAASLSADADSDGYINIEEYLNGTNPVALTETVTVFPTLPGMSSPAQDLDGDGKAEDLNGNGRPDFADVLTLYQHLTSQTIQDNKNQFDFTGDGWVDSADVSHLFYALY